MMNDVLRHYELLIDEGNDSARDPAELQAYMDLWDGEVFLRALDLDGSQSVLEIGVGTGRLALRIGPECRHFTGVDLSPKTIVRARENLSGLGNVTLCCGDFMTVSFDASFDVIYSSLTFLHIERKAEAIAKIAALLTPGGRAVISLDKNPSEWLDYGTRRIRVYPDDRQTIAAYMSDAGLTLLPGTETEFAYIVTGIKE